MMKTMTGHPDPQSPPPSAVKDSLAGTPRKVLDARTAAAKGKPFRVTAPYNWHALHSLVQAEFAFMEGRIDPPSSVYTLTQDDIASQARAGEIWAIEDAGRPVAVAFLSPRPPTLYICRLAVARSHRNAGLGRSLIDTAEMRARDMGLKTLTLQSRIELTEIHAIFNALGFAVVGTTAHPGFARPTSITLQRPVTTE